MALVDLVRRVSASGACVLALCAPAIAGDSAQFNALGYSHDGRYFAFEQFGIQDGSGFPYADIFVVDLVSDSFVGGSPFRARINEADWNFEEEFSLPDIRAEALAMAEPFLTEEVVTLPAIALVLRGDGTLENDGLSISYGVPTYGLAQTGAERSLSLDIFKAEGGQDCQLFEGDPMGFALFGEDDGARAEIHRDTRVPASRNCVITYKFYGVFNPFEGLDDSRAVAVLSVWSHGFEGPDRRFIAVPVGEIE